jgi:MerC mercury resistance protein
MQTELSPTVSKESPKSALRFADRLGATASFLCAVHCVVLPFVLAALPAFGLGFLADHGFEHAFILCASVLALFTLIQGYRRHRIGVALALLVPGLLLLWLGGFVVDLHDTLIWHAVLVAIGGSCVAGAHLTNMRLVHVHEHGVCCDHVHDAHAPDHVHHVDAPDSAAA